MNETTTTVCSLKYALQTLRRDRGLTQASLGATLGVNQSRISQIETDPGSIRVSQLLEVLGALSATLKIHYTPEPADPGFDPKCESESGTSRFARRTTCSPSGGAGNRPNRARKQPALG